MNSLIARISSLRTLATPQRCLLGAPRMMVQRPYALRYFST